MRESCLVNRPFLVAQISDLHLKAGQRLTYGVVDTLGALRRAVDHLNASHPRPDIVVISGDLVDFGRADEYAVLHPELARLHMPCYLVPGNHDTRGPLLDAFRDHTYLPSSAAGPLDWVVDAHPLRLIGLDSTIPGGHGGPHMDREPFINAAALETVVARHPQVERLLCGHLHRSMQRRFGGSLSCVCPGTSHQIVLDLQDAAPAHFNLEPAGYLLHRWDAQQGLVSHNGVFGDYPGPYPFYDAHGLID